MKEGVLGLYFIRYLLAVMEGTGKSHPFITVQVKFQIEQILLYTICCTEELFR
jgi:hypothetical protein